MSGEIMAIIGVGVALAGLLWRLHADLSGRLNRVETRVDTLQTRTDTLQADVKAMHVDLHGRLTAIETTLSKGATA